jgi:hypothetical protein
MDEVDILIRQALRVAMETRLGDLMWIFEWTTSEAEAFQRKCHDLLDLRERHHEAQ